VRHGSADLRDRVIRYNEQGVSGLSDRRHGCGTPAKLTDEEKAQLATWCARAPTLCRMAWCVGGWPTYADAYSSGCL
jgi:transposase